MADIRDRVRGGIDTAAEKTKGATDQAANAAKEAADRLGNGPSGGQQQGFMDRVRDNAESAMHTVGEYAGQVGGKVEHWAEDAYHAAGHYAKDFGQELTGLIRRYPVPALLVGFGLGLVLGRAVRA